MQTFCLLKPDAFLRNTNFKILDTLREANFKIVKSKKINKPTKAQVEKHFEDLKVKNVEAFHRNVNFFLTGPVEAMVVEAQGNAVKMLRKLVGPTDPEFASKQTIRGKYCVDTLALAVAQNRGLENSIHASDSAEAARNEANIWGLSLK